MAYLNDNDDDYLILISFFVFVFDFFLRQKPGESTSFSHKYTSSLRNQTLL